MSYSDFIIQMLRENLNLDIIEDQNLFSSVPPASVPPLLTDLLQRYLPLAITISTEKVRSELIIAPILAEFKLSFKDQVSLFSGIEFNVDVKRGLNGRCDYIIAKSKEQLMLQAPVLMLVEAKNDNITGGIPQCLAEMVAAHLFNQQKNTALETVYDVVTTGSLWRFLKLEAEVAYVDVVEHPIQQLGRILGILTEIVLN